MKKMYGHILIVIFFLLHGSFAANGPEFVIEEENVEITVQKDSSLDMWYFLTIKTTLGPQKGIYFGIPKEDILDYSVTSENAMLDVEKQGSRLKIYFPVTANSGDITRLKIHLVVPEMVYKDEEGRVGVQFIPAYWDYQDVNILRVKLIAPEGVTKDELGVDPAPADNFGEENGRAFAYWERSLSKGEKFRCGISFPEGYVTNILEEKPRANILPILIGLAIILIIVFSIGYGIYKVVGAAKKYTDPIMSMESLGVRKDLDNIEAAVLLGAHPFKIINILLFGLVKKGRIKILKWSPVKVEILPTREKQKSYHCPNCGAPMKGKSEKEFCEYCGCEVVFEGMTFYYENQFLLKGIKKNGTLDGNGVRLVLKSLNRAVDRKIKGYCRRDTEKYYKEKIERYWGELKKVSPEERYRLFGENAGWLMIDEKFDGKADSTFRDVDTIFRPTSWWIWYNLPKGRYSGKEFAKEFRNGKKSIEKNPGVSAKKLAGITAPTTVAHSGKSCVCACVSCACACACVSCACACATGGGF
ncbi:MAG: hypothetical protein ACE5K0_04490 [Candidatus Methanofastidiosia archaeon]